MERSKIWKTLWILVFVSFLLLGEITSAVNILALFPLGNKSHNYVFTTITKALAQKGHSFTVVTSQPIDSPPHNYRQINVYDIVAPHFDVFNVGNKMGFIEGIWKLRGISVDVCREVLQKEEVKELTKPNTRTKFDLILISNFFSECYYPFARVYNAPIVLLSNGGPMPNTNIAVGNVMMPSYFAEPISGYSDRMNFKERVVNTLTHFGVSLSYKYYFQRGMEHEMRAAFGEDTPSISELEEYVSLAVLNNHFSLNQARPTVPCLIEAGGLHIKEPKELPKDLKAFLDGAGKEGAIYFSLGSFLKSSNFSKEIRDELITAFSRVKQRVLWKWEGESPLPGQPKNVRVEKWLPQQDVLAHPNIKLFITHGGLLSFQEAATRGVPLIGIPFYGDQNMNVNRVLDQRVGVKLDPNNLTASNILDAIHQVLGNSNYSRNMKRLQSIVTDQKDHPLERAVYWIEYVIRHKGAKHLKPAAFYLHWSQISLLDVLFVIIVIPSLVSFGIAFICFKVFKRIFKSRGQTTTSTKKTE